MNLRFEFKTDDFGEQVDLCMDELIERMKRGTQLACMMIEADAVKRCPKGMREGSDMLPLADSITTTVDEYFGKVTGVTGSNLHYAVYVHEGTGEEAPLGRRHDLPWTYLGEDGEFYTTRGQKPNPFLQDAFDSQRKRAEKKIMEVVRNG